MDAHSVLIGTYQGSQLRNYVVEAHCYYVLNIGQTNPNMNLDSGLLLSMVWNPILKPPPTPLSPTLSS